VNAPTADATDDGLNLKQVAATLGAHYRTAYRYVRQGRLPADLVAGGWVVRTADLEEFRSRAGDRADGSAGDDRVARLRHLISTGDEPGAWRHLDDLLASGATPQVCLSELLPQALAGDGTGVDDRVELARSYLATATASRLVDRLAARHCRPGRARGAVLLAAPRGELHRLPLATVAALVRLGGYRTVDLGIDVPPDVIAAAAGLQPFLAVGIGVTTAASVEAAVRTVAAVRAEHPDLPVVVGGQAVRNADVAELVGTRWWAPDGPGVVSLLDDLARDRTRRRRADRAR
jgi:MerR family transcriptional regulator, light-induced transcriptional regulator